MTKPRDSVKHENAYIILLMACYALGGSKNNLTQGEGFALDGGVVGFEGFGDGGAAEVFAEGDGGFGF